ncbi:S9 family peptidase [Streptosporangiaceae bacterium NEAU-GS5]|nr:S9 family peptidase [Streptosporangiaceae bacterium NEAU-GS5]
MRPADLAADRLLTEVAVSPDGATAAVVERRMVRGKERHRLLTVPTSGGAPRVVHTGDVASPRFSPDGTALAFLSGGRVHVVGRGRVGGPGDVAEFAWLGDGFVVLAEDEAPADPPARVIRRLDWREEGHGLRLRPVHAHLVGAGGETSRLTSGGWRAWCLRPSPCGTKIGFLADPAPDSDLDPNPQVHEVPVAGGPVTKVSRVTGPISRFSYDPDGSMVCLAPPSRRPTDFECEQLWLDRRTGPVVSLTGHLDRFAGQAPTTDERLTVVCDNGREIAFQVGETLTELTPRELDPVTFALSGGGGVTVAILSLHESVRPDLYRLDPTHPPRPILSLESPQPATPTQRELEIAGVQTFVIEPPGRGPFPSVLMLHGGPAWAWPVAPDMDAALLAANGYLVIRPNIRGSFHRGHDFGAALGAEWGGVDADDCHAVLDELVHMGLADPGRLGCYGNSYGGFLVNWLIGTSSRFAAAISQNGVTNQVSGFGACDLGAIYDMDSGLGDVWTPDGVSHLWRISPLRNVAAVRTPLLLLQGERDLRCPPSDAEQMFVALRRLGRTVEYVLYPDAGHEMAHDMRLDRRVDRAERILDWFGRHLL